MAEENTTKQNTAQSDSVQDYDGHGNNYDGRGDADTLLHMGSARSDYGENAYEGRLDKRGLETAPEKKRSHRHGGARGNGQRRRLMITGRIAVGIGLGVGIGLAAMFMFDPKQGKSRRKFVTDKISGAGREVSDVFLKASNDIRERGREIIEDVRQSSVASESAGATASGEKAMANKAG